MRRVLFLAFAASVAVSAFAQTGSMADLRADEQRLHRKQVQLDQDRERLALDRRSHASRAQIRLDQMQIKRDRLEIRQLKADIRRDRQARSRYRSTY
jgi:outer membrane murein-binding lipoprotein Lpp